MGNTCCTVTRDEYEEVLSNKLYTMQSLNKTSEEDSKEILDDYDSNNPFLTQNRRNTL